jgi:hypothetical protein
VNGEIYMVDATTAFRRLAGGAVEMLVPGPGGWVVFRYFDADQWVAVEAFVSWYYDKDSRNRAMANNAAHHLHLGRHVP